MNIQYELGGHGSAVINIWTATEQCEVVASSLSDALGDLARAARAIARGDSEARVSFVDEPGELRLVIHADNGILQVKIYRFKSWSPQLRDENGEVVLRTTCIAKDFVTHVIRVLETVLNQHGVDGYRRRWIKHDFPIEILRDLTL